MPSFVIATFDEMVKLLKEYVRKRGGLPDRKDCWQGQKIGDWCARQRKLKEKEAPSLTSARMKKLESVKGWWWDEEGKTHQEWRKQFDMVREFFIKESKGKLDDGYTTLSLLPFP
jgi:hypothetical protein